MNKEDRKLLEDDGWDINCESPFEISDDDGSEAKGRAADYILDYLKLEDPDTRKLSQKFLSDVIEHDCGQKNIVVTWENKDSGNIGFECLVCGKTWILPFLENGCEKWPYAIKNFILDKREECRNRPKKGNLTDRVR